VTMGIRIFGAYRIIDNARKRPGNKLAAHISNEPHLIGPRSCKK
jgi:hypothetical protein